MLPASGLHLTACWVIIARCDHCANCSTGSAEQHALTKLADLVIWRRWPKNNGWCKAAQVPTCAACCASALPLAARSAACSAITSATVLYVLPCRSFSRWGSSSCRQQPVQAGSACTVHGLTVCCQACGPSQHPGEGCSNCNYLQQHSHSLDCCQACSNMHAGMVELDLCLA
jgi:hypothetical protein